MSRIAFCNRSSILNRYITKKYKKSWKRVSVQSG